MKNKMVYAGILLAFLAGAMLVKLIDSTNISQLERNQGCYSADIPDMSGRVGGVHIIEGKQYLVVESSGRVGLYHLESPELIRTNSILVIQDGKIKIYN